MTTVAIGDIHGMYDMFDRLLVEIDAFSIREREIGCEFRRKPAGDTDLKPARVPI